MSLVVMCSGQGAQSPGLFESFPFSAKALAVKERIIDACCLEPEVAAWLEDPSANPEAIFQNHFSQPLISLWQLMVWAELSLPSPRVFAGYSLGELSAYGCAGALKPEDVVRLAGIRAKAMDAAGAGELIAVTGLGTGAAHDIAGQHAGYVAIVLEPDHCVLGVAPGEATAAADALQSAGAGTVSVLAVSVPSHTPLLDAAVGPFRAALASAAWSPPASPVLAGIDASKVSTAARMQELLPEQIHRTVRWDLVQQRIKEEECQIVLELGPGSQLAHAMLGGRFVADARSAVEFRSANGISEWVQRSLERFA